MQEAFDIQLRKSKDVENLPLNTLAHAISVESAEVNRRSEVIGRYLIQAKEQLPDETGFMAWVSENCPFSHSTALALMKYARGLNEIPSLIGRPKSIVLEVMRLPAAEREGFSAEIDGKSVREIRRLIEERDEARRLEELAKKAHDKEKQQADLLSASYEKISDAYYGEKERADALLRKVNELSGASPVTVTVEVPPPDYGRLKDAAQHTEQEADALRRAAREAEAYAEEQEALRKQAQSELRRILDGSGDQGRGGSPFSSAALSVSFQSFLGNVGTMPHMSALFCAMPHDELREIRQWLDVFAEWLDGASKAVDDGFRYISGCDSDVV